MSVTREELRDLIDKHELWKDDGADGYNVAADHLVDALLEPLAMTREEELIEALAEIGVESKKATSRTYAVAVSACQRIYDISQRALSAAITRSDDPVHSWQPIETAPKGHRQDILIFDRGVVRIAWWGAAAYNRKTKEYDLGWTNGGTYGFQPSHWMPLPSAPAALTAKQTD